MSDERLARDDYSWWGVCRACGQEPFNEGGRHTLGCEVEATEDWRLDGYGRWHSHYDGCANCAEAPPA